MSAGFARDPGTLRYYDRRAGEYDEWYGGEGAFAARDRPGWDEEQAKVVAYLAELPPPARSTSPAAPRS
ncbi:MAG TPA: hypothetical protein VHR88_01495 [Solirubrobacteraceae bacterium]|nr:hypothetical protein [Solirubrobacteraceae bacterium]